MKENKLNSLGCSESSKLFGPLHCGPLHWMRKWSWILFVFLVGISFSFLMSDEIAGAEVQNKKTASKKPKKEMNFNQGQIQNKNTPKNSSLNEPAVDVPQARSEENRREPIKREERISSQPIETHPAQEPQKEIGSGDTKKFRVGSSGVGIMFGMGMHTMEFTDPSTKEALKLTNTGISTDFFYDHHILSRLTLRLAVVYDAFSVKGTANNASACENQTPCIFTANYIGGSGHLQFDLINKRNRIWLGFGGAYLTTMKDPEYNIPLQSDGKGKVSYQILFSFGTDFNLSKSLYFPFYLSYAMYPGGEGIKLSSMYGKIGLGYRF